MPESDRKTRGIKFGLPAFRTGLAGARPKEYPVRMQRASLAIVLVILASPMLWSGGVQPARLQMLSRGINIEIELERE